MVENMFQVFYLIGHGNETATYQRHVPESDLSTKIIIMPILTT